MNPNDMKTIFNETPQRPPLRKLSIGIQSFEKLRQEGYEYVDKTALIYRLTQAGNPCFLSRPRRFGKSLLLSTIEAYYLGKRELFKGLDIEQLEQNWHCHPVIHLSLNAEKYDTREALENILERQLRNWEELYQTGGRGITHSGRFMEVIRRACEQTGRRVVVLVDEYDKPLLRTFDKPLLQQDFRETLTAFYTVLKDADPWLQFVFITGVTKFAQVGIFSNLNQLSDISFDLEYNTLCGLTAPEIARDFAPELEDMARKFAITHDELMRRMAQRYDGYRFTSEEGFTPMFNPFSVLNALQRRLFGDYWFASGTPTFLVDMLTQTEFDLREIDGIEVPATSLSDDRANVKNPIPMIYQSGYLTIKQYDPEFQIFTLGFPNDEVKYGFLNFVTPFYTSVPQNDASFHIGKFVHELRQGQPDAFLSRLRAFFADFPYELSTRTERHYQVVFYLVFKLLGQYTQAEVRTARGRADAVVKTADYLYIFEFKLDGTARQALTQIDDRGYATPYAADPRHLFRIGAAFDAEERNLGEWIIEEGQAGMNENTSNESRNPNENPSNETPPYEPQR